MMRHNLITKTKLLQQTCNNNQTELILHRLCLFSKSFAKEENKMNITASKRPIIVQNLGAITTTNQELSGSSDGINQESVKIIATNNNGIVNETIVNTIMSIHNSLVLAENSDSINNLSANAKQVVIISRALLSACGIDMEPTDSKSNSFKTIVDHFSKSEGFYKYYLVILVRAIGPQLEEAKHLDSLNIGPACQSLECNQRSCFPDKEVRESIKKRFFEEIEADKVVKENAGVLKELITEHIEKSLVNSKKNIVNSKKNSCCAIS